METRTIFALKADSDHAAELLASLHGGVGRFGWSYAANADLRRMARAIDQGDHSQAKSFRVVAPKGSQPQRFC